MNGSVRNVGGEDGVTICLRGFSAEALKMESERLHVPVAELAAFAIVYYLADVDRGRISREPPRAARRHRVPRLSMIRRRRG